MFFMKYCRVMNDILALFIEYVIYIYNYYVEFNCHYINT